MTLHEALGYANRPANVTEAPPLNDVEASIEDAYEAVKMLSDWLKECRSARPAHRNLLQNLDRFCRVYLVSEPEDPSSDEEVEAWLKMTPAERRKWARPDDPGGIERIAFLTGAL